MFYLYSSTTDRWTVFSPGAAPAVDLLFSLDRVTAVEHVLKSVLLYTLNDSVSFPAAVRCLYNLVMHELASPGRTPPTAPHSFTFNSEFELRRKHKWVEVDVTALLQPLVASGQRSIHMSVSFTCVEGGLRRPSAQSRPRKLPRLAPPSLLLYLNDTSAQAYHRLYPLHHERTPLQAPDRAYPTGREAAKGVRPSRHRRGQEAVSSAPKKPPGPASFNLSEYFRQFLFPQNECELHDFRLSFSQLKWDNWIVAPHRYNPRYCKGDCPRAVRHRYGSPVHTVVQNIICEKQLDSSVPRPSCVPAHYSPLSVLTIEPDGSIAYKEYEDMIATKCTCR